MEEGYERRDPETVFQETVPTHVTGDLPLSNFSFTASKDKGVDKCKSMKVKIH